MSGYRASIHIASIYNFFVASIVLFFILFIAAISIIPFKESVRLQGYVSDYTVQVRALRRGTVEEIAFSEGDTVDNGSVLFTVNLGRSVLYEEGSYRERVALLERRISDKYKQIDLQDAKHSTQKYRYILSADKLEKQINLKKSDLLSYQEIYDYQKSLLDGISKMGSTNSLSKRDINSLRLELAGTKFNISQTKGDINSIGDDIKIQKQELQLYKNEIDEVSAAFKDQILELKQKIVDAKSNKSEQLIVSNSGVVSRVYVKQGDFVEEGQILATLVPLDNHFEVHLRSPSSQIGKIVEGQPTKIWYKAFPHAEFGFYSGIVAYVGREPNVNYSKPLDGGRNIHFLVKVSLDQPFVRKGEHTYNIVSGSAVDAIIKIEDKKIITWLFSSILELINQ